MTDVTSTRKEAFPVNGQKAVMLVSGTTVTGATDTLTMTLADFGMNRVLGVLEWVHTTDYSVIIAGTPTCAVSGGVLTVTTTTGNNNKRRCILVFGE